LRSAFLPPNLDIFVGGVLGEKWQAQQQGARGTFAHQAAMIYTPAPPRDSLQKKVLTTSSVGPWMQHNPAACPDHGILVQSAHV